MKRLSVVKKRKKKNEQKNHKKSSTRTRSAFQYSSASSFSLLPLCARPSSWPLRPRRSRAHPRAPGSRRSRPLTTSSKTTASTSSSRPLFAEVPVDAKSRDGDAGFYTAAAKKFDADADASKKLKESVPIADLVDAVAKDEIAVVFVSGGHGIVADFDDANLTKFLEACATRRAPS